MGIISGADPKRLDESGWGIIFAHDADPQIKEALGPLLALRQEQASEHFRVYDGPAGHRPGESKARFLARHGAGPGPADPSKVPYYLLIAGSPERIPYRFQQQLDVQYAVGRIHFDSPDEYANYAASVVAAENEKVKLERAGVFFATANADDRATQLSRRHMVDPLFEKLSSERLDWHFSAYQAEEASKAQLAGLLGGDQTPALLFAASHGMSFPLGSSRQLGHQGALLCQDWPGPRSWEDPIPQDFYFAGDDLAPDANLLGLIAWLYASYSAGTPQLDEFAKQAFNRRATIAPHAFQAQLPAKMLSHSRGGALAVIGQFGSVWGHSFIWPGAGRQTAVVESALQYLLDGHPVGAAVEWLNERYAELATALNDELEEIEFGKRANPYELSGMWTANNDARAYAIIGDPAVKLAVVEAGETPLVRTVLEVRSLATAEPAALIAEDRLFFNGVYGDSGQYDQKPMDVVKFAEMIQEQKEVENLADQRARLEWKESDGSMGFDPGRLEEAGWGVIFGQKADEDVKEALRPLLDHRRKQAGERFRMFEGKDGFRRLYDNDRFLTRHGAGFIPVDPDKMPYYLLVVGDLKEIPLEFQARLDVAYASGRIHFDTPEEYASYARSVVAAERGEVKRKGQTAFSLFAPTIPDDVSTQLSYRHLARPLSEKMKAAYPSLTIDAYLAKEATKEQLGRILGGDQTPALLLSASHGVGHLIGGRYQESIQGGILGQDWPGPERGQRGKIDEAYFAAGDLAEDADLAGLIAFFISSYSAATRSTDEIARLVQGGGSLWSVARKTFGAITDQEKGDAFRRSTRQDFVARLPAKMLAHPGGGALAVVGRAGRSWGFSLPWISDVAQAEAYESAFGQLLDGMPLGAALEPFRDRRARRSTFLSAELEEIAVGKEANPYDLVALWAAWQDTENILLIGDPAVRMGRI